MEKIEKRQIVEQCTGCKKITEDGYCMSYFSPPAIWRLGNCPLATHIEKIIKVEVEKKRAGQQKQKKATKPSKPSAGKK